LVTPALGERRERAEDVQRAAPKKIQPAPHQYQVGVIGDVGAGRSKMNERLCGRCRIAERVNVRHHVMTKSLLVGGNGLEVDLVEIGAHLLDRSVRDRDPQLTLGLGERQPKTAPKPVTRCRRPQLEHRLRCVPLGER